MSGYYETALICLNGHVITNGLESSPEMFEKYCRRCGQPTISQCPRCQEKIRGYHHIPGVIGVDAYHAPAYCHNCGNPYPWTEERLKAAKELIELAQGLSPEERQLLKDALPAVITDTPQTTVAATRLRMFLGKATVEIAGALRQILVDIASETAKKIMFPGQ